MARPRSFDPDEALDLARDVFWQQGFQGTSLDDITAATGLAKPSLYAAFGDKNALFLKVLERYHARIVAQAERIINDGPSARDAVHRWLTGFVPFCSGVNWRNCCETGCAPIAGNSPMASIPTPPHTPLWRSIPG